MYQTQEARLSRLVMAALPTATAARRSGERNSMKLLLNGILHSPYSIRGLQIISLESGTAASRLLEVLSLGIQIAKKCLFGIF
jgi:hypothetical protein